ncbi:MAG: LptF/LptG family permease [Phycisphaerales bacterium]|nr:LptF/LptG family permease [Phycisphaerales bacterium]MCB9855880.1 LptF/LptG family permease [Phycisphaerales bacterium]
MKTLYAYFAREMVKAFSLTLIALTLLIVMGGGIASMFTSSGLGADEIGSVFIYLVPVALLYTTPVAALFAATVTYGRASTDNEILACKAAGINLHRVLTPTVVAGLLAGAVTFMGFNFLMPELAWQVEDITRRDLPKIVSNRFLRGKPLIYAKRVAISAEKCVKVDPKDLPEKYREGFSFLRLTGVAFQEMSANELVRIGTADETIIKFDNTSSTPEITLELQFGRSYDAQRRQYLEFDYQLIGPISFPLAIQRKIQFENLWTLLDYQAHPIKIPEIDDLMHGMRRNLKTYFLVEVFKDHLLKSRGGNGRITLKDDNADITLEASGGFQNDPTNGRIRLKDVVARVREAGNPIVRVYRADFATVQLNDGIELHEPIIQIELRDDVQYSIEGDEGKVIRKPKETLPAILFRAQPEMEKAFEDFDEIEALSPDFSIPIFSDHAEARQKLIKRYEKYHSEIRGEIHLRMAISAAVLAMVVMGAMLGITLRGGQVLTAVFISMIPGVFTLLAFLVARSLSDRPQLGMTSVFIVWGATAVLYAGVGVIGFKVLKR